eukprot:gene30767-40063_t
MGVLPFEDKLLDVHYYESVETILVATYKKYGKDYDDERATEDLAVTKALHKSFKALQSGSIIANLIAQDDPQQRGYIPKSVGAYVDAAAGHASKKAELDHSARLYQDSTWNKGPADTSAAKRARQKGTERLCTGCGGHKHDVADCLFADSRWFNSKPGLAFMNSDKGKEYFAKFGFRFLRMRDVARGVRDHAQKDLKRCHMSGADIGLAYERQSCCSKNCMQKLIQGSLLGSTSSKRSSQRSNRSSSSSNSSCAFLYCQQIGMPMSIIPILEFDKFIEKLRRPLFVLTAGPTSKEEANDQIRYYLVQKFTENRIGDPNSNFGRAISQWPSKAQSISVLRWLKNQNYNDSEDLLEGSCKPLAFYLSVSVQAAIQERELEELSVVFNNYTKRQVKKAEEAARVRRRLFFPSDEAIPRLSSINNIPVTRQDIMRSIDIFGRDRSAIRGKLTDSKTET